MFHWLVVIRFEITIHCLFVCLFVLCFFVCVFVCVEVSCVCDIFMVCVEACSLIAISSSHIVMLAQDLKLMKMVDTPMNFMFFPHGVALLGNYLYVVNHAPNILNGVGISVFKVDPQTNVLLFQQTIQNSLFVSLNAVKPLNSTTFLAVNDHFFSHPLMQLCEDFLGLRWSSVVECTTADDGGCRRVISNLESTAVGLEARNGEVYVAQTLSSSIAVHRLGREREREV